MRFPMLLAVLALPLALGACAAVMPATEATLHRGVDTWCAHLPAEMRREMGAAVGTTAAGNSLTIGCGADALRPMPRPE